MSYEFAKPEERAYFASFPQIGLAIGLCTSTGVVTFLSYVLSERDFVSWGWRLAFMLSIALLAVGLFIRLRVLETPEFAKVRAHEEVSRVPMCVRHQFILEAGKKRLAGDTARAATSDEVHDLRREATALKEVVADLTLENRLLKKSVTADGEDGE